MLGVFGGMHTTQFNEHMSGAGVKLCGCGSPETGREKVFTGGPLGDKSVGVCKVVVVVVVVVLRKL